MILARCSDVVPVEPYDILYGSTGIKTVFVIKQDLIFKL